MTVDNLPQRRYHLDSRQNEKRYRTHHSYHRHRSGRHHDVQENWFCQRRQ